MKFKGVNFIPFVAKACGMAMLVAIVGWFYGSSLWQQSQAGRSGNDIPLPSLGWLPRAQSELATVINVHDGDTITVKQGWQKVKVRLCGIDAPELP